MFQYRSGVRVVLGATFWTLGLVFCDSGAGPDTYRDFIVDVNGERFVMRTSDPSTIQLATAVLHGGESLFPIGPLRRGDGGFNAPWSWHLDPDDVRMTQVAAEVCDALPSYVEEHLDDFMRTGVGFCPWSAKIVAEASTTAAAQNIVEHRVRWGTRTTSVLRWPAAIHVTKLSPHTTQRFRSNT